MCVWLCSACDLRPTNHEPVYGIRHIGERIIRGCASALLRDCNTIELVHAKLTHTYAMKTQICNEHTHMQWTHTYAATRRLSGMHVGRASVMLSVFQFFRFVWASWRREGYWIPTKTCNSGRLHNLKKKERKKDLNDVSVSMDSQGVAPLFVSRHVSCLSIMSCLSFLFVCRLGLCPFGGLVRDLLIREFLKVFTRSHVARRAFWITIWTGSGWRTPSCMVPYLPLWEGTNILGATFLGRKEELIVVNCYWYQPTNVVNNFYPLKSATKWRAESGGTLAPGLPRAPKAPSLTARPSQSARVHTDTEWITCLVINDPSRP